VAYEAVNVPLRLPGEHNRLNAGGALAAAVAMGADPEAALRGIVAYGGAERRFQILFDDDLVAIDDYAHHPTEIEASVGALRERYPGRRIVVAFQPHLYSRTADLIPEFAAALDRADQVLLTDIYPAREDPMPGVSSARIAEAMRAPVRYVSCRHLLPRIAASLARPGDVVVGMGAGTIHEFAPEFVREWSRRRADRPKRVAVVLGGDTSEREVSLHSGRAVLDALKRAGFEAFPVDVSELLLRGRALDAFVGPERPDVVFLAIHGTPMEGGAAQGLFELLHLPYTGSGMLASALAMDKAATKARLRQAGIPVPNGWIVGRGDPLPVDARAPLVVKPNREGSTVGLTFVDDLGQLPIAVARALDYDDSALIEERVLGMEISVPVLGDRALPAVEIVPATGRYDFARKYLPGATEEIVPARLPEHVARLAQERALVAHRALGCEGATRTDFIVRDGTEPIALEVNTLPGLTKTSLLPNSAKAAGIEFEELVRWIVEDALARSKV
jgi:D-alanine--D-alanine ligase